MQGGAMCISIDLELAWGFIDRPLPQMCRLAHEMERPIVGRLLDLFRKYEIKATWAIVAGLLDKDAPRPQGSPSDIWYAPDVIDMIRQADPRQEVGSHSYAHVYFGRIGREQAASDLTVARQIHQANGLEFLSFVFPKNVEGHHDLLAINGIRAFRSGVCAEVLAPLGRAGRFVEKFLPMGPKRVDPHLTSQAMIDLPGSLVLIGRNGPRRWIPSSIYLEKARRGLAQAMKDNSLFHFWFHPSNFYFDPETQFGLLEKLLAHAAEMRDKGRIRILPMKAFAACEGEAP